jgi:RNA polymerase sigma factor (sigma-70 family)
LAITARALVDPAKDEPTSSWIADGAPCSRGAYRRLWSFVRRRLRSNEETADIVQDAYVHFAAASQRTNIRNPSAFLRVTALNIVRDRARAAVVRRNVHGEMEEEPSSLEPSAEEIFSGREQLAVLLEALGELSMKQRAALVLYRFDGLSHAEIATRLCISVSMSEKYVKRALDHCRKRLADANGHS